MIKYILRYFMALLPVGLCCACGSQSGIANYDVAEFAKLLNDSQVQLLDVRTPDEFAEVHIPGALLIDINQSDFEKQAVEKLDKTQPVAVYCRSGRRSMRAADILQKHGYRVTNLKGGILQWKATGMPCE